MSYSVEKKPRPLVVVGAIGATIMLLLLISGALMAGCPVYNVWMAEKAGQAQLAEARGNRQIKIQEAQAAEESARHLAAAEIARARGVASANQIIGQSLKGNDAYLRYLWITSLSNDRGKEVIYVPTEANLPILEAHRLGTPAPESAESKR